MVRSNEKAFESLNVLFDIVAFALEEAANLSLTHFEDPISAAFRSFQIFSSAVSRLSGSYFNGHDHLPPVLGHWVLEIWL